MTTHTTLIHSPEESNDLFYDKEKKEVSGKDFKIKFYNCYRAEIGAEYSTSFEYVDNNMNFFYKAYRGFFNDDFSITDSGTWIIMAHNLWQSDKYCT